MEEALSNARARLGVSAAAAVFEGGGLCAGGAGRGGGGCGWCAGGTRWTQDEQANWARLAGVQDAEGKRLRGALQVRLVALVSAGRALVGGARRLLHGEKTGQGADGGWARGCCAWRRNSLWELWHDGGRRRVAAVAHRRVFTLRWMRSADGTYLSRLKARGLRKDGARQYVRVMSTARR